MSHQIYASEALQLGSQDCREADRLLYLLTPDWGLVRALARGARKIDSKLRPHLLDGRHLSVALVRGRELWRLTSVRDTELARPLLTDPARAPILARLLGLLRRLVRGELPMPVLFADIKIGLTRLGDGQLAAIHLPDYELWLVARILSRLGYVDQLPELASIGDELAWIGPRRPEMLWAVNRALTSSGL